MWIRHTKKRKILSSCPEFELSFCSGFGFSQNITKDKGGVVIVVVSQFHSHFYLMDDAFVAANGMRN